MKKRSSPIKLGWFRAVARYYRDPGASFFGKLIAFLAIVYVVVPVDLVPDVPLVGWLDDLGVVGIAMAWLTRRIAPYREARAATEPAIEEEKAARSPRPFSLSP